MLPREALPGHAECWPGPTGTMAGVTRAAQFSRGYGVSAVEAAQMQARAQLSFGPGADVNRIVVGDRSTVTPIGQVMPISRTEYVEQALRVGEQGGVLAPLCPRALAANVVNFMSELGPRIARAGRRRPSSSLRGGLQADRAIPSSPCATGPSADWPSAWAGSP